MFGSNTLTKRAREGERERILKCSKTNLKKKKSIKRNPRILRLQFYTEEIYACQLSAIVLFTVATEKEICAPRILGGQVINTDDLTFQVVSCLSCWTLVMVLSRKTCIREEEPQTVAGPVEPSCRFHCIVNRNWRPTRVCTLSSEWMLDFLHDQTVKKK